MWGRFVLIKWVRIELDSKELSDKLEDIGARGENALPDALIVAFVAVLLDFTEEEDCVR